MVYMTREHRLEAVPTWDDNPMPEKMMQPNGGWLRRGGKPGNRGGGRPKSVARRLASESIEEMVQRLIQEFYGDPVCCPNCGTGVLTARRITVSQKARILEVVAKIALPKQKESRDGFEPGSFVVKVGPSLKQVGDPIEEGG